MPRQKLTRAAWLTSFAVSFALGLSPAAAMQFSARPLPGGQTAIVASGPIVAGDLERMLAAVALVPTPMLPPPRTLAPVIVLDSPGGNVLEAQRLSALVRTLQASVSVGDGAICASACFLVFAAGQPRFASGGARIGVHSASADGQETSGAMAATLTMARAAAAFGVPGAIVGKMVTATPSRIEWLTPDDLATMDTRLPASTPGLSAASPVWVQNALAEPCAARPSPPAAVPTVFTAGCASVRLTAGGS